MLRGGKEEEILVPIFLSPQGESLGNVNHAIEILNEMAVDRPPREGFLPAAPFTGFVGQIILVVGDVLCTGRCLAASMVFTYQMPAVPLPPKW